MNEATIVLPSARAIRQKQLSLEEHTLFLPNYITMNEFISKLCIVKGFKTIDTDTRVLLLLEASDFDSFSTLQIQRNFFTFTKNSSYIFKFFEELSAEMYDIDNLNTSDIYGEYEEHITILQELYKRYENLCLEKKVLDKIFLPKLYEFNSNYAKTHKSIELHVDGHLTNFELELLSTCRQYCEVDIIFTPSRFNTKVQEKLREFGLNFDSENYPALNKNISCESFSEPLLQVAFAQKKIYDFINKGYKPQKIAVVVPDESFADILKSFDNKYNFNFAMGEPFRKTKIYEKLSATSNYIDQDSRENEARLERVGDDLYQALKAIYHKKSQELDILEFLKEYVGGFTDKSAVKIFNEELYSFKNILPYMLDMSIKSVLSVFLQRLAARTLDDVAGGKITVMGVLETRSVEFDAVVIVDFSDSNVPKRSDKDMFLNTAIREMANLPTMSDRENLQKHYYEMLINRSKEVAISYVSSSESSGSRFLKQLGIKESVAYDEAEYAKILFKDNQNTPHVATEIKEPYSFKTQKLSATRLKNWLTCKRKYYYKYIKHIYNHEIPKDMPQEFEIGLQVHKALEELYIKQNSYESVEVLKKALHVELDEACGRSELEKYLIAIQKRNLDKFCEVEVKRFKKGWQVYKCEEKLTCKYNGMILEGSIDRIDKRANEIEVLDYKTGKYPLYTAKTIDEATDFQLEFYYLLAGGFGNVTGCYYYDLKESKIISEQLLEEKLERLKDIVEGLLQIEEVNFELCEDEKNCTFCEYKIMCGREL
mgnify:CR=1 FL=1